MLRPLLHAARCSGLVAGSAAAAATTTATPSSLQQCSSSSSRLLLAAAATAWQQQAQRLGAVVSQRQQVCGSHTAAAAAPSAVEPCMLMARVPASGAGSGGQPVVHYPYALPPQYASRSWQLQDLQCTPLGAVELPGDVFNVPVRTDILHQVVRWQRAKARQGTHKTKDRSEVSGGGRKPWQQKGSGRARQGSIRAPQWRGGGIAHGPVPRSYAFDLPRKVRRLGLKCALSAKAREGRLILVDSLRPWTPKTKAMSAQLQQLLNRQATAVTALSSAGGAAAKARAQQGGGQEVFTPGLLGLPHMVLAQAGSAAAASSQLAKAWGRKARRARAMRILSGVQDFRQQEAMLLQQAAAAEPGRAAVQLLLPPAAAQDAGSAALLARAAAPQPTKQQQRARQQQQAAAQLPVRMSALLLDSAKDGADGGDWLRRASRNLPGVEVVPAAGANVLSLLRRDYVIMTKPALDGLIERLRRPINRRGAAGRAYQQRLVERRAAQAAAARQAQLLAVRWPRGGVDAGEAARAAQALAQVASAMGA